MSQKRLRIFVGPNGSGKSILRDTIKSIVPLGFYINADDIERQIINSKKINLEKYGVTANTKELHKLFDNSEFVEKKSDADELKKKYFIKDNILKTQNTGKIPPKYTAAIIAEFLREINLKKGNDFSFETVMSHASKIDFIKKANRYGYHVYLYFVCIDDVRVNINRVKSRVKTGGHSVPMGKIKTRYKISLSLLYNALKVCYKSYLFDNSDKFVEIARIDRDKKLYFSVNTEKFPNWFIDFVLNKITLK